MSASGRKLPVVSYRDELRLQEFWSSNLSFTATFSKRKTLILLEKIGVGLWFLASEKRPYGTEMGLVRYFGAQVAVAEWWLTFASDKMS